MKAVAENGKIFDKILKGVLALMYNGVKNHRRYPGEIGRAHV